MPATLAPRLGAKRAIAAIIIFVIADLVFQLIAVVSSTVAVALLGDNAPQASVSKLMSEFAVAMFVLGGVLFAALEIALIRFWIPFWFADQGPLGFGPTRLPRKQIVVSFATGILAGLACLFLTTVVLPTPSSSQINPLWELLRIDMAARIAWAFSALVIYPPVYEVFFRGILLKGFTESWGLIPASVAVTLITVAMQFTDIMRYWPSVIALTIAAVGTLLIRLQSGSVLAAILFNVAYNVVTVVYIVAKTA